MQFKTPEERKAIAAKSHATRRARLDEKRAAHARADGVAERIKELELKLSRLQKMEVLSGVAENLTGKFLLTEGEIAEASLPMQRASGVYFLLKAGRIAYVGQSVSVFSRIAQHADKEFDSFAYILCNQEILDSLESLYIHILRPPLNGNQCDGTKTAPIALEALFGKPNTKG